LNAYGNSFRDLATGAEIAGAHIAGQLGLAGKAATNIGIGIGAEDPEWAYVYRTAMDHGMIFSRNKDWGTKPTGDFPDWPVLWWEEYENSTTVVYRPGEDAVARFSMNSKDGNINLRVFATSIERARELIEWISNKYPKISDDTLNEIDFSFWYSGVKPTSYERVLAVPAWTDIQNNYPESIRGKLAALMAHKATINEARLILWRGEPGSGKTYALRALARSWRKWATPHYVLDPDRMLDDGKYLLDCVLGDGSRWESRQEKDTYRLIVLEDCGELITKDARGRMGQGFSRLLNLCDGILGQGVRFKVLITTNEDVKTLNDAVSRPGRCMTSIEFPRFSREEALTWFRTHDNIAALPGAHSYSLADLYAILEGREAAKAGRTLGFGGL
jgi:hypothetical protein